MLPQQRASWRFESVANTFGLAWAIATHRLQPDLVKLPQRKKTVVLSPDIFREAPDHAHLAPAAGTHEGVDFVHPPDQLRPSAPEGGAVGSVR